MWFDGPITEAISKTKSEKTLLIVFIEGSDENSVAMKNSWENDEIQNICKQQNCVALKLEKNSESAKQFSAICKILHDYVQKILLQIFTKNFEDPCVCIPISFLIGLNGKPLDVIPDSVSVETLAERLLKALEVKETLSGRRAHESAKSPVVPSTSGSTSPVDGQNQNPVELSLNERIAKAQELIKVKREEKAKQQEEDEKTKELKRREEGKNINEARERLKEKQILEAAQERKRDKMADRDHLQKLREQIAADRLEKKQAFDAKKSDENEKFDKNRREAEKVKEEEAEKARLAQIERCKTSRIQFRFPDGSSMVHTFDAETPFLDAFQFVGDQARFSSQFHLIQMLPRREFTADDLTRTFKELDLVPSAVLMILPDAKSRWTVTSSQQQGWFDWLVSMVTAPLAWLYSLVFGQNPPGSRPAVTAATASNRTNPTNQNFGRQEGNVHRMPNAKGGSSSGNKKDDDDNATWNGNSTQQL